ncbi:MAG: hypothetical protein L0Z50_06690 [Verrucomicrobiales bacterium]|nr:hypothetical protein [Verrucomicrobiales bacterium]
MDLYADRTRSLPASDPADRELTMSCGAALLHLRVALEYFGYANRVMALFPTVNAKSAIHEALLGLLQIKKHGVERSNAECPAGQHSDFA